MKRKLERGAFDMFGEDDGFDTLGFDLDIERPIAEKMQADPDMLEESQQGKTKRKLVQTDFADENTRGSIA
jgi:hypothetical protein